MRYHYLPAWLARPVRWTLTKTANLLGSKYREGIKAFMLPGIGTFFLIPDPPLDLVVHEDEHHTQCKELGSWRFAYEYIIETLIHGYWDNRFEKAARKAAGQ